MVSTASVYGPSRVLMEKHMGRFGVESSFIDTTDLGLLERTIRPNTKVVYVESPSNPAMLVTDLRAAAGIAHASGALLVVDNTFASPYLQKPLDLGADVVLHSVTKFLNGHADVVGGVLVAKTEALLPAAAGHGGDHGLQYGPAPGLPGQPGAQDPRDPDGAGPGPTPIESPSGWERHPKVEWVSYLGLPSHPQSNWCRRQMSGPGRHDLVRGEGRGGGRRPADGFRPGWRPWRCPWAEWKP